MPRPDSRNDGNAASARTEAESARAEVDRVQEWYDKFFEAIIVISSLGSGFTFSLALTPPTATKNSSFSPDEVTTYVSLSGLFFTLGLAVSSSLRLAFALDSDVNYFTRKLNRGRGSIYILLNGVLCVVQTLTFLGFFFASLSVAAFQAAVGYVAVSLTGSFICLLFSAVLFKIVHRLLYPDLYQRQVTAGGN